MKEVVGVVAESRTERRGGSKRVGTYGVQVTELQVHFGVVGVNLGERLKKSLGIFQVAIQRMSARQEAKSAGRPRLRLEHFAQPFDGFLIPRVSQQSLPDEQLRFQPLRVGCGKESRQPTDRRLVLAFGDVLSGLVDGIVNTNELQGRFRLARFKHETPQGLDAALGETSGELRIVRLQSLHGLVVLVQDTPEVALVDQAVGLRAGADSANIRGTIGGELRGGGRLGGLRVYRKALFDGPVFGRIDRGADEWEIRCLDANEGIAPGGKELFDEAQSLHHVEKEGLIVMDIENFEPYLLEIRPAKLTFETAQHDRAVLGRNLVPGFIILEILSRSAAGHGRG